MTCAVVFARLCRDNPVKAVLSLVCRIAEGLPVLSDIHGLNLQRCVMPGSHIADILWCSLRRWDELIGSLSSVCRSFDAARSVHSNSDKNVFKFVTSYMSNKLTGCCFFVASSLLLRNLSVEAPCGASGYQSCQCFQLELPVFFRLDVC